MYKRQYLVRVDVGAPNEGGSPSFDYVFVTRIASVAQALRSEASDQDDEWLKPGKTDVELKYSQAKGGPLVRRINRDLTVYAIKEGTAPGNAACARNAQTLINLLKGRTPPVREVYLRENSLVFGKEHGRYVEIITFEEGLAFPETATPFSSDSIA